MAGLGEACTHVAAIPFYVEAVVRCSEAPTCTQESCKWITPSFQKDTDFTLAKVKKRKLEESSADAQASSHHPGPSPSVRMTISPTSLELQNFFQELSKCGSRPVILSLIPEHAHNFVPKARLPSFPTATAIFE